MRHALLVALLLGGIAGCGDAQERGDTATSMGGDTTLVLGADPATRVIAASLLPQLSEKAGLPLERPVQVEIRTRAQLEAFLRERLDEELPPERAEHIVQAYHLLGMMSDTVDLRALLLEVYLEQVAGYYDPVTSTLYLLEDQPPDATRSILLHELVHAVQDQAVSVEALTHPDRGSDTRTAAQAAIEGHATLIMLEAMAEELQGRPMDLSRIPDFGASLAPTLEALTGAMPALAAAPPVIRESLLFPYVEGAAFVHALWVASGGRPPPFDEYLPAGTVDILHPGDFLGRRGWVPRAPFVEGPTDRVRFRETLGAQDLRVLLQGWGEDGARDLVRGWAGDALLLVENDAGRMGLVLAVLWRDAESRNRALTAIDAGIDRLPRSATVVAGEEVEGLPSLLLRIDLPGVQVELR